MARVGSAICAAVGQGPYGSWDHTIEHMVSWEPSFSPDLKKHEPYRAISAIYDEVPSLTDKIFEQSYKIFG